MQVPGFAISSHKVTNREFLRFVREGGYDDRRFWSDADWGWIKANNISHPHLLLRCARTSGYIAPCSKRYRCRWTGRSTSAMRRPRPMRALWAVPFLQKRSSIVPPMARRKAWSALFHGEMASRYLTRGNFDFQHWDPVAAGSTPAGRSSFGLEDAVGNGWEWTSTPFAPHQGFDPVPFYPGYSADFFDGHHFVVKGGFAQDCCMPVAALVPQLVPAALSLSSTPHSAVWRTEGSRYADPRWRNPDSRLIRRRRTRWVGSGRQKMLPSKYLYDDIGSALFEAITRLPEYGLTRAEERILRRHSRDIAEFLTPWHGRGTG